ncbi:MAG: N-acetylmuramoyl-L-alanine amidase [Christensenellaceae bacterium]|jgi:N-acetylmuramoyl-L-alanine amidase|nr:N-acetylmuramoyl-L-alanine amidase [Christensenellaceae bacterium]
MATIVLDAGHGGYDYGAVNGTRQEKDDNLRMTLAVGEILKANGQNVVYTRSDDTYVSLADRARISNAAKPSLFVSFHRNAATNESANGWESYISPSASSKSKQMAEVIYDAVARSGVFASNRGLKTANYYVLSRTSAPATLLELGFITNDADNVRFDENFDTLAQTIANSIMTAVGATPGPSPTPTPPSGNARIREVQSVLNSEYGQNLTVDGLYGPATYKAMIRALQIQLNENGANPQLNVDGIWGPKTKAAVPLVRLGDRGNMVWLIQAALILKGYDIAADGVFGSATRNALINFQSRSGISADGIAGPNTFEKLFA